MFFRNRRVDLAQTDLTQRMKEKAPKFKSIGVIERFCLVGYPTFLEVWGKTKRREKNWKYERNTFDNLERKRYLSSATMRGWK